MGRIAGYREVDEPLTELVNLLKAEEERVKLLVQVVEKLGQEIGDNDAGRWASLARTNFEQGYMWLVKAATRPTQGIGRKNETTEGVDTKEPTERALAAIRAIP